jgi:hypothetical protein
VPAAGRAVGWELGFDELYCCCDAGLWGVQTVCVCVNSEREECEESGNWQVP